MKTQKKNLVFTEDDYLKVSVGLKGITHLSVMTDGFHTLCGRWWWAENNHGDSYCRTCQHIFAVRKSKGLVI